MDEDVPMREDAEPIAQPEDGLEQYDLENYDAEEAMPCMSFSHTLLLNFTYLT